MADSEMIQSVAKELRTAEEQRRPVAPVAGRFGDLTVADAYAVQQANIDLRLAAADRILGRKIGLVDTVADNASSGRFVMPSRLTPVRDLDLRLLGGIMEINGVLTSWSCGAAALGDPAACLAWLANSLALYGGRLEAGEIVL